MEKNDKRPYEAPQLTTVTFKAERGYAASLTFAAVLLSAIMAENGTMEAARTDYGNGGNSEWGF